MVDWFMERPRTLHDNSNAMARIRPTQQKKPPANNILKKKRPLYRRYFLNVVSYVPASYFVKYVLLPIS